MKIKIIIFLIIVFVNLSSYCKPNKYIDNNIGFSIEIPDNILLINNMKVRDESVLNKKYGIERTVSKFKDFRTEYSKKEFLKRISEGEKILLRCMWMDNNSVSTFKYKGEVIGQSKLETGGPYFYPLTSKGVRFLKDNYIVHISINYYDFNFEIPKKQTDFFVYEEEDRYYYWKPPYEEKPKEFYNLIKSKSKKAPKELVKLEAYFEEIIKTLELFEPDNSITLYSPTVKKLSFREAATLDAKRIRMLEKGEKLELLEKGKTETIGDATGTWVKVKTEKGETGWCFDAYLKRIKGD